MVLLWSFFSCLSDWKLVSFIYVYLFKEKCFIDKFVNVFICPLYIDEDIVNTTAVEATAKLMMNDLKMRQPELLKYININKFWGTIKKKEKVKWISNKLIGFFFGYHKIVATLIGKNIENKKKL